MLDLDRKKKQPKNVKQTQIQLWEKVNQQLNKSGKTDIIADQKHGLELMMDRDRKSAFLNIVQTNLQRHMIEKRRWVKLYLGIFMQMSYL